MASSVFRKAVGIRRNDGQIKECEVRQKTDGLFYKKGSKGRDGFVEKRKIYDFVDGTQCLLVCERQNPNVDEPFNRKLPGPFSHDLFFGDLIIVYIDFRNVMRNFLVEDMRQITAGTHALWCVHSSTDVGEKEMDLQDMEADEEDDEDEDESSEEKESDDEDEISVASDEEDDGETSD